MIIIIQIASSSKGNCYRISDGTTPLLLEAGVRLAKVREVIGFTVTELGGCLITHEHSDHSRYVKELVKAGVDCYMSAGTADALEVESHRIHRVRALEKFTIGSWSILPFDAVHDAREPLGYLLASGTDKLLFVTDTAYITHRFTGLTHIMIECNYCAEVLDRNVANGSVSAQMKKRLLFSHFGLEKVAEFMRATDRSRLKEVWLLHASNGNSDAAMMKRTIQGIAGCPVYVAKE